jgi:hypothetical protein
MDMGSAAELTNLILMGEADDLINKGPITEMVAGWEFIKYMSPRTEHDLYYWENFSDGCTAEVDYLLSQNMKVLPVEIKSGVTGKMKSLRLFMQKKHILEAKRCSLENFGEIEFVDAEDSQNADVTKKISIHPLHSLSTLLAQ